MSRQHAGSADDQPVVVFEGAYQDAVFLFSLLSGSGIEAHIDTPLQVRGVGTPRILVRKSDVERAVSLIQDFKQNGKRAEDWPPHRA